MPDDKVIARMYDDSYCGEAAAGEPASSLDKFSDVLEFTKSVAPGRFLDYGCGDGLLLREMKAKGWDVVGVDFNPEFASALKSEEVTVLGPNDPIDEKADVVHLGDVLEHLTEMDRQFPAVLDLLKDGGYLIAHGPLEANRNLFFRAIKLSKDFRGRRVTHMPPYHVTLSTSRGQRALFHRFGLQEVRFAASEVAFPAAERFSSEMLTNPRATVLFALRKISQLISRHDIENLGNRYFYVGRKRASQQFPS
jgi:SAM-dependent methyltransferase